MAGEPCPACGQPTATVKVRRVLRHVPMLDPGRPVERRVRMTLVHCAEPAGCGRRFLLPVAEITLPAEETTLRYLAPDKRLKWRSRR